MKKPLLSFFAMGIFSLAAITLFSNGSVFAQGNGQGNGNGSGSLPTKGNANLPFWGLHGSTGDSTTFAGTTNANPFLIKVNNLSRASFTNSGLTVIGGIQAKSAIIDSIASAWQVIVSDALSVSGNATFNGIINANNDIYLASGKAIKHPTSNGSLTFDGFGNTNTIGLGYNINTPDSAEGLVIIPKGNSQFANGAVLLGDADPNGEILITLNGSAGGRLNIRGWEKKTYLINDGGEKITLDGVNGNSLWETTKGLTLATRSGNTFTENYHLNIQGNLNSQQYYQNDTLVDLVNLQTTVTNIKSSQWQNDTVHPSNIFYSAGNVGIGTSEPSVPLEIAGSIKITGTDTTGGGGGGGGGTPPTPAPSKSIIIDGGLDRITATSGTIDFVNTNLTTTGSIQSNSMTTANLTITDRIESDTMHARRSLEVNNSLTLKRDTAMMYAEVSTKEAVVALMFQKDSAAEVVIGDAPAPATGEARAKLTVLGNTKLDGSVNVSGNLTAAGTISANTFNADMFSSDSLFVSRIMPAVGDSEIHIGDSSIIINGNINSIAAYGNSKGNWKDLYFQNQNPGFMLFSGTNNTLLNPYFGNVGVGVISPTEKLEVNGNIRVSDSYDLLLRNSHHGLGWYGTTSYGGVAKKFAGKDVDGPVLYGYGGGALGVYNGSGKKIALLWDGNGNVGVGTDNPQANLHVAAVNDADNAFAVYKGSTEQFRIMGDGRVGIGTTTIPQAFKMAIKGKLLAEDVTVLLYGDWVFPDYVYKPGYKRPTLEEKEKYHKKYGRMMYMDSADEIKESGLNISKNFVGLTRNVEEVGEDVIVLQKTVVELQEEIRQLKKELEKVKNK